MDPVSHSVTGCLLANSFFTPRLGMKSVFLAGAAAAFPDVDMVLDHILDKAGYVGTISGLWLHRGITHTLLFHLLAAPILGYLCWRLADRKGMWPIWAMLSFLALASHSMLDNMNGFGTPYFAPFYSNIISWATLRVVDPLTVVILGLGFLPCALTTAWDDNRIAKPGVKFAWMTESAHKWLSRATLMTLTLYFIVVASLGWRLF